MENGVHDVGHRNANLLRSWISVEIIMCFLWETESFCSSFLIFVINLLSYICKKEVTSQERSRHLETKLKVKYFFARSSCKRFYSHFSFKNMFLSYPVVYVYVFHGVPFCSGDTVCLFEPQICG